MRSRSSGTSSEGPKSRTIPTWTTGNDLASTLELQDRRKMTPMMQKNVFGMHEPSLPTRLRLRGDAIRDYYLRKRVSFCTIDQNNLTRSAQSHLQHVGAAGTTFGPAVERWTCSRADTTDSLGTLAITQNVRDGEVVTQRRVSGRSQDLLDSLFIRTTLSASGHRTRRRGLDYGQIGPPGDFRCLSA